MAKGSGLAIDHPSSHSSLISFFDHNSFLPAKQIFLIFPTQSTTSITIFLATTTTTATASRSLTPLLMDSSPPAETFHFPVNLNRVAHDQEQNRPDEMDFFAHKREDDHDHDQSKVTDNTSDADNHRAFSPPPDLDSNVNVISLFFVLHDRFLKLLYYLR